MLDAALAYGARGWQVFPCRPRAKTPLTTDGFKSATTDEGTIHAWWSSTPTANVGIATGASGLLLLDVDIDDDVRGDLSLIELEQRCDRLPDTLVCWTPRGCGFHLYYTLPPGVEVPCSTGRLGPGLDVRSTGGYTIAPPSIHPNGDRYLWPDPDADVTPAPDWLLELCRKPTPPPRPVSEGFEWSLFRMTRGYADAALRAEIANVSGAPVGQRNATLNTAAFSLGQLVGAGLLDAGVAASALLGAGLAAGLDDHECRRTITSGLESGIAQPRTVAS